MVNWGIIFVPMEEPSKIRATRNSGYFRFFSISHSGEVLELLFSADLFVLELVHKMYRSCNFEYHQKHFYQHISFFKILIWKAQGVSQ